MKTPCPQCPDGYVWTSNGPTCKPCPRCKGLAYLGEDTDEESDELDDTETVPTRIEVALDLAMRYGGIDGAHHKTWVIDQMVRALTGTDYANWVQESKVGEDGPNTYTWDEGIAP